MERGIDWDITLSLYRSFESTAQHAATRALEAIVFAGSWPAERIHEVNEQVPSLCPRCGDQESDLHTWWVCPSNAHLELPEVEATQKLRSRAREQYTHVPCLWLRGILPAECMAIPHEHRPCNHLVEYFIDDQEFSSGLYFGDAPGAYYLDTPL